MEEDGGQSTAEAENSGAETKSLSPAGLKAESSTKRQSVREGNAQPSRAVSAGSGTARIAKTSKGADGGIHPGMFASSLFGLKGKVALITGGKSTIGQTVASLFLRLGASVAVTDCSEDDLNQVCSTIGQHDSERLFSFMTNSTAEKELKAGLDRVMEKFGTLDVLVNVALVPDIPGSIEILNADELDKHIAVYLRPVYIATRIAAVHLETTKGCIINISNSCEINAKGSFAKNICLAGIRHLTACGAEELKAKGIRVNAVDADLWDGKTVECSSKNLRSNNAAEVANVVAFLSSDASSGISGVILPLRISSTSSQHFDDSSIPLFGSDYEPFRPEWTRRLFSMLRRNRATGRLAAVGRRKLPRLSFCRVLRKRKRVARSLLKASADESSTPPILTAEPQMCLASDAPVYKNKYITKPEELPLALITSPTPLNETLVSHSVPKMQLTGESVTASFLVDKDALKSESLYNDGLGPWSNRMGHMSTTRYVLNKRSGRFVELKRGELKSSTGVTAIIRKEFSHPACSPPGSIKKTVWQVSKGEAPCRYAVISYGIAANASFPGRQAETTPKKPVKVELLTEPATVVEFGAAKPPSRWKAGAAKTLTATSSAKQVDSVKPSPSYSLRSSTGITKPNRKYEIDCAETLLSAGSASRTPPRQLLKRTRGRPRLLKMPPDDDRDDGTGDNVECNASGEEVSGDALDEYLEQCENSEDFEADLAGISVQDMLARVSRMTSARVYRFLYLNLLKDVPIKMLTESEISDQEAPVNTVLPQIQLTGEAAHMAFIVDLSAVTSGDLNNDGLGSWNSRDGKRVSVQKFYLDENFLKCSDLDYEYCLMRRRYIHSHCDPPFSVRKIIWQIKGYDQKLFRYALISYSLQASATIDLQSSKPKRRITQAPRPAEIELEDSLQDAAIAQITSSPVYKKTFINSIDELPITLLLEQSAIEDVPVCTSVPQLDISHIPPNVSLKLAFIIDMSETGMSRIGTDNLGSWNASGGPRMTVRKSFFTWDKVKCQEGEHDFTIIRRIFVHPNGIPEGGLRKVIWLARLRDGSYGRYIVISYDICANASVLMVARGRPARKTMSPEAMIRKRLREKGYDENIGKRRALIDANTPLKWQEEEKDHEPFSHDDLVDRMSQPSTRHFTEPYHNDEPFTLLFLSDISVGHMQCASCNVDFSRVPMPPEDIVIEHIERFWNQRTSSYSTQQMQKRYIHARIDCILSRYEYFTTADFLSISPEVRDRLTEQHLEYLYQEFGCTLE